MLTAITRGVSPLLAECELTWLDREPIDISLAIRQHSAYVQALQDAGARVIELPALDGHPDCVFVEDPALVLDEVAVITTMVRTAAAESVTASPKRLQNFVQFSA